MSDLVCIPRALIVKIAQGELPTAALVYAAAQAAFPQQEPERIGAKFACAEGIEPGRAYVVKDVPATYSPGAKYPEGGTAIRVPGPFASWLREEFLRRFRSEYVISRRHMDVIWPILSEASDPRVAAEQVMAVMEDVDANQQEIKSPGAFAAGMLQRQGLDGVARAYQKLQSEGTAVQQSAAHRQERARRAAEAELAKRTAPVLDPAYASEDEDEGEDLPEEYG